MGRFKQLPRLQMIGNHRDHRADLHDCLIRAPAIQEFSRKKQASVRVGRYRPAPTAQPLQLVSIFSGMLSVGSAMIRHGQTNWTFAYQGASLQEPEGHL